MDPSWYNCDAIIAEKQSLNYSQFTAALIRVIPKRKHRWLISVQAYAIILHPLIGQPGEMGPARMQAYCARQIPLHSLSAHYKLCLWLLYVGARNDWFFSWPHCTARRAKANYNEVCVCIQVYTTNIQYKFLIDGECVLSTKPGVPH